MDELRLWRLYDALTVTEATLLILGVDPSNWDSNNPPEGYSVLRGVLKSDIETDRLKATVQMWEEQPPHPEIQEEMWQDGTPWEQHIEIDWKATRIKVDDLRDWLKKKNLDSAFFFPESEKLGKPTQPAYLDSSHKYYSPKLAAAVAAWEAVTNDPGLRHNRSPRKALVAWLEENAAEYELVKDDGTLNNLGIEEVAKVANWQPQGGVPKTPG